MRIKRVEIIGFKSFVDRTSLEFPDGISAVLGPNGCGKSNIIDAIRWAMGEQNAKNLRGRSMDDVIFGGSEKRKPLGMAEVSMVFANDGGLGPPAFREYPEIMITRRLYRSGESEYLINKTPCRLLDISELFMDTGVGARAYSIIEQGKIGMILNARPEERRILIEEAAGVTKFKSRKKSALRKIEATRQNLLRLSDIISEVRRQLAHLKRQAQKAQRYRECREELRTIETRFARLRLAELEREATGVRDQDTEQARRLQDLAGQLAQAELAHEELRLEQVVAEKETASGQERIFALSGEIQQLEARIEIAVRGIDNLDREKERLITEDAEVARRLLEADAEEAALRTAGQELESLLLREQRRLAEGETALEELTAAEDETGSRLEESRRALFALLGDLSRLGNLSLDAQRRLQGVEERTARNRREAVTLREQQEEAATRSGEVAAALEELLARRWALAEAQEAGRALVSRLQTRLDEHVGELLLHREDLNRVRSRLESLQELERRLEGYGQGVRLLMQEERMRQSFGGMVADLLEVPAALEVAVEAVLGDRLQTLLVPDGDRALQAVAFLKDHGGRGSFLLPSGEAPRSVPFAEGKPLLDLISLRGTGGERIAVLLHNVYLVDDLWSCLSRGLPAGVTVVTAEGEILTGAGELNGGAREGLGEGPLHKRREIKELNDRLGELQRQVENLQQERSELRQELQQAEEVLREAGIARHRQELLSAEKEKDLALLRQSGERLGERLEVLSLEEDQLHEEREGLQRQLADADHSRLTREEEKATLEAAVAALQEELQVHRSGLGEVRDRVTTLKVSVASLREREEGGRRSLERLERLRQELRGRLALLGSRREEADSEQARLRGESDALRAELARLFARREEQRTAFEALRERFEEVTGRLAAQEESLRTLRSALSRARELQSELQLRLRELEMEAEHLRQGFLERFRIDLQEVDEPGEFDGEAAAERLQELRRSIDDMGEVNLTAIEEYEELDGRHRFLTAQQEDLRQSLEGLQTAITRINRTTRKRFRETFDQINAKFQEVFPRLFRGGSAELKLTDEEDLLETGIEIIVQPPGKKLQSVNLLSGGEKALTAVALIFSIFLIKPSPFCILDEVDAPLDDANIGRFNEIVREMCGRSQFIIITHNKRTMEIADTLYGVTMEEPGVSKLVSVRMNEL